MEIDLEYQWAYFVKIHLTVNLCFVYFLYVSYTLKKKV